MSDKHSIGSESFEHDGRIFYGNHRSPIEVKNGAWLQRCCDCGLGHWVKYKDGFVNFSERIEWNDLIGLPEGHKFPLREKIAELKAAIKEIRERIHLSDEEMPLITQLSEPGQKIAKELFEISELCTKALSRTPADAGDQARKMECKGCANSFYPEIEGAYCPLCVQEFKKDKEGSA